MNLVAQLGRIAAQRMLKHAADLSRRHAASSRTGRFAAVPSDAATNSPMNRSLDQQQQGPSSPAQIHGATGGAVPSSLTSSQFPSETQRHRDAATREQLRASGLDGPRGPQGRPLGGGWGSTPMPPVRGTAPMNY
jgi:hypothetical protein